ncbi:MAG: FAD-dependent oxidoreductase [Defluviitaleaceae bacterium]|nr:FAD-dependent oxidoreductase [Defluviitaleaceae bacterium]
MKHVIIGAGAAGISAAKTIRTFKPTDEIVIISTDDVVHSRCMLHHYISDERNEKTMSFIDDNFFQKNNIRWINGKTVTGVDTIKKLVVMDNTSESFDTLLIATGSDSISLPHIGVQNYKNMVALRSLSDAKMIREHAKAIENIIIVGAGLVGLDVAYALIDLGKKPTVVDMSDTILQLNLDTYASNVYRQKFEEAGCMFHLGKKVSTAEDNPSGNIVSLTLDSGEKLPCNLVIVAIGSRPGVQFLSGSGIVCENGLTVNAHLATNVEGIYGAGDVTGLSGLWPNAIKQGEVAAKNMVGISTVYEDVYAIKNTINYFGIPSLSIGRVESIDGDIVEIRESRNSYAKVILHDGLVNGVLLQGDISHSGFWQYLIKNNIDVSQINKSALDLSFADFYGMKVNGEYEWVV